MGCLVRFSLTFRLLQSFIFFFFFFLGRKLRFSSSHKFGKYFETFLDGEKTGHLSTLSNSLTFLLLSAR